MADLAVLDTGPLGEAAKPRGKPAADLARERLWLLMESGYRIFVPEIADYEIRRELFLLSKDRHPDAGKAAIRRLARLRNYFHFDRITSDAPLLAAAF